MVVRASLEDGGRQPIGDLPVRLLPYDRQGILDSLGTENEDPEPKFAPGTLARLRSLQAAEAAVKARGDTAVGRIQAQRRALLLEVDSIRKAQEKWLEKMKDDFEKAVQDRVGRSGLMEKADTTDAAGRASFEAEPGKWWAVARYVLPDEVLEWQVPVTAREGDSTVVRLTRKRAREEPFF